jgi:hypothetical protein
MITASPGVLRSALTSLPFTFREGIGGNGAYFRPTTEWRTAPPVPLPPGEGHDGTLYAQILMQLVHVGFQAVVGDHVNDLPMLHHVVPVRHGLCETKVLLY